jgi:hypothetical protein
MLWDNILQEVLMVVVAEQPQHMQEDILLLLPEASEVLYVVLEVEHRAPQGAVVEHMELL